LIHGWADFEKVAAGSLKKTQQFELKQWERWKTGGEKPEDLRPLLRSLNPLVQKRMSQWKNRVPIPPAAMEAEFKKHLLTGLRTYNPDRGAQLSTHVYHQMRRADRWIKTHQNFGYIPEERVDKIGQFRLAEHETQQEIGRPPTTDELAQRLKWSPAQVSRMQRELRADIPASGFSTDPAANLPSKEREALRLVQWELTPEEKIVFEHSTGMNGKELLTPGQIAQKLKMSPSKVSRLRNAYSKKLSRLLYG